MAPTLQKNYRLGFALDDGAGLIYALQLPINPEDLTRVEPSRTTVMQTLDGGWIDSFGRGYAQLTINGHTGWGAAGRPDGVEQFIMLRDHIIHRWHEFRRGRINRGEDPNDVRMFLVDPLNYQWVGEVVPMQFTLKRNRSNPLLMYYNIALTVINDRATNPAPWLMDRLEPVNDKTLAINSMSESLSFLRGIQSRLASILSAINSFARKVRELTDSIIRPILDIAQEIINTANMVRDIIRSTAQIAIDLATSLARAATKLWDAVASVASLPAYLKSEVMRVKSAFSNLMCVLSNGFGGAMGALSYGGLYGSSNCSSTAGGSPSSAYTTSGSNPFADLNAVERPRVSATPEAINAINAINAYDTVENLDPAFLAQQVDAIQSGVSYA